MDRDQRFQRFREFHRFLHVRSLERRALIDALYISSRASGGSGSGSAVGGSGKSGGSGSSGLPSCPLNSLPTEADEVAHDILAGGPFDHPDEDGSHFGNYQRILPRKNSNFYREYTVETPGVGHRGARRIVVGGGSDTDPDVWYYTDDHYESFCEIPDAEK